MKQVQNSANEIRVVLNSWQTLSSLQLPSDPAYFLTDEVAKVWWRQHFENQKAAPYDDLIILLRKGLVLPSKEVDNMLQDFLGVKSNGEVMVQQANRLFEMFTFESALHKFICLAQQSWFFGSISTATTAELLYDKNEGSFLARFSTTDPRGVTISYRKAGEIMHIMLRAVGTVINGEQEVMWAAKKENGDIVNYKSIEAFIEAHKEVVFLEPAPFGVYEHSAYLGSAQAPKVNYLVLLKENNMYKIKIGEKVYKLQYIWDAQMWAIDGEPKAKKFADIANEYNWNTRAQLFHSSLALGHSGKYIHHDKLWP